MFLFQIAVNTVALRYDSLGLSCLPRLQRRPLPTLSPTCGLKPCHHSTLLASLSLCLKYISWSRSALKQDAFSCSCGDRLFNPFHNWCLDTAATALVHVTALRPESVPARTSLTFDSSEPSGMSDDLTSLGPSCLPLLLRGQLEIQGTSSFTLVS